MVVNNTMQGKYRVLTFYKYVTIDHPSLLKEVHYKDANELGIRGRVLISPEGINGAVCGNKTQTNQYIRYLHSFHEFKDLTFRTQYSHFNVFEKLQVKVRKEVINSGLADFPEVAPEFITGKHLSPDEFYTLKDNPDVVILDVRSDYEHKIGHFKNAVTLDIQNFREFPDKIKQLEKYRNKKIITYCTGGVKCEKASAYLLQQGFNEVYQLKGGIVQYGNEKGGEDFEGRCYVFDRRVTVDVNHINPKIITRCLHCNRKTDRLLNCVNPECNEQVVICNVCSY